MKSTCRPLLASILGMLFIASICLSAEMKMPSSYVDEEALWKLEHHYWRYVQSNDLTAYLDLWHKDFLGWPSVNPAPVGKDHITDWITSQTSKGLAFKSGEFKPAAIHVSGNVASLCYWITYQLVDKDGNGQTYTLRITHAWIRSGSDWRIIAQVIDPRPSDAKAIDF